MLKSMKAVFFLIAITLILLTQSCLDSTVPELRTEETELQEIDFAIQKLETAGYDVDTTESGLYYVIQTQGTGPFPIEGDTCYVEYATYTIDGSLLDTSTDPSYNFPDGIWEMEYLESGTIAGFYEGLGMMNKGMEADFIIPSKLAYGEYGTNGIPEYTPLVFSVKLHDLKPKAE